MRDGMNERKYYRVIGTLGFNPPSLVEYTVRFRDGETRDSGHWHLTATPPGRDDEANDDELNRYFFATPAEAINAALPKVRVNLEAARIARDEAMDRHKQMCLAVEELERKLARCLTT